MGENIENNNKQQKIKKFRQASNQIYQVRRKFFKILP